MTESEMLPAEAPQQAREAIDIQKNSRGLDLYSWIEAFVFSLTVVIILFNLILRPVKIDGSSMIPTLYDQDRVMITHLFYEPEQGDIVVINQPNFHHKTLIKRVVATEGQTLDIDYEAGIVYVDGEPLDEPYIKEATRTPGLGAVELPAVVPENCVFVMGDNRNDSSDSRDIGFVQEKYIMGRAVFRIFPFSRFGPVS